MLVSEYLCRSCGRLFHRSSPCEYECPECLAAKQKRKDDFEDWKRRLVVSDYFLSPRRLEAKRRREQEEDDG